MIFFTAALQRFAGMGFVSSQSSKSNKKPLSLDDYPKPAKVKNIPGVDNKAIIKRLRALQKEHRDDNIAPDDLVIEQKAFEDPELAKKMEALKNELLETSGGGEHFENLVDYVRKKTMRVNAKHILTNKNTDIKKYHRPLLTSRESRLAYIRKAQQNQLREDREAAFAERDAKADEIPGAKELLDHLKQKQRMFVSFGNNSISTTEQAHTVAETDHTLSLIVRRAKDNFIKAAIKNKEYEKSIEVAPFTFQKDLDKENPRSTLEERLFRRASDDFERILNQLNEQTARENEQQQQENGKSTSFLPILPDKDTRQGVGDHYYKESPWANYGGSNRNNSSQGINFRLAS